MSENKYSELVQQFMQIQWRLMRHSHHNRMMYGMAGNPYRGQGRVLKLLKMQPEISQRELLELLDMRPQSLGDLLRKLELKGYVTRTPSEQDKRVMMVRLTEQGMNAEFQDGNDLGYNTMFDCLSDEEQAQLSGYLTRILDACGEEESSTYNHRGFRRGGPGRGSGHGNGSGPDSDSYWGWRK